MSKNFNSIDDIFVSFKPSILKTIFPHNYTFQTAFSKVIIENDEIVLFNQDLKLSDNTPVKTFKDIQNWNKDFLKIAKKEKYSKKEIQNWTLSEKQLGIIKKLFDKCQSEKDNFLKIQEKSTQNQSTQQPATPPQENEPFVAETKINNTTTKTEQKSFFDDNISPTSEQKDNEKFLKVLFVSDDHIDKSQSDQNLIDQFGFVPAKEENIKQIIDLIKPSVVFHNGDLGDFNLFKLLNSNKNFKFHYVYGDVDSWISNVNEKISKTSFTNISFGLNYQIIQIHGDDDFVIEDYVDNSIMALNLKKVQDKIIAPNKLNPDIITFGHSHQYLCETRQNVLHLNPGSTNYESWLEKQPLVGSFAVVYLSSLKKENSYLEKYEITQKNNQRNIKLVQTIKDVLVRK